MGCWQRGNPNPGKMRMPSFTGKYKRVHGPLRALDKEIHSPKAWPFNIYRQAHTAGRIGAICKDSNPGLGNSYWRQTDRSSVQDGDRQGCFLRSHSGLFEPQSNATHRPFLSKLLNFRDTSSYYSSQLNDLRTTQEARDLTPVLVRKRH